MVDATVNSTATHSRKANGAAPPPDEALADITAAKNVPNIDGRASVLEDLPKDLFLEDRDDFAINEQKVVSDEVRFGRGKPLSQEIVRCHPTFRKKAWCLKKERGSGRGDLYLVPESMIRAYPRLKNVCKQYRIRLYVTDEGVIGLWAAPLPGHREAPSDAKHLEAQETAVVRSVRFEWTGEDFEFYVFTEVEEKEFGERQFPDRPWEEFLRIGLANRVIDTAQHPLCKNLLRGAPGSGAEDSSAYAP
jgi:hypothetical protein